jgi:hypothetical protein
MVEVTMPHCPSNDWDHFCNAQDKVVAAELKFWNENRALIATVAATLAAAKHLQTLDVVNIVDHAGDIVREIVDRGSCE